MAAPALAARLAVNPRLRNRATDLEFIRVLLIGVPESCQHHKWQKVKI
jgi:hypothetical protein